MGLQSRTLATCMTCMTYIFVCGPPQLLASLFHCFTPQMHKLHFLLACWPDSVDSKQPGHIPKNFTRDGKSLTNLQKSGGVPPGSSAPKVFTTDVLDEATWWDSTKASPLPIQVGHSLAHSLTRWQCPRAWVWGHGWLPLQVSLLLLYRLCRSLGLGLPRLPNLASWSLASCLLLADLASA